MTRGTRPETGETLNVFVLHGLGAYRSGVQKTIRDHALSFRRYAPRHRYYYHDIRDPVSEALKDVRFQVVLFDTTALNIRTYRPRGLFLAEKERYRFVAEWDAVKIAFPQDDYDHSAVLDDWLADYRFDVVYSVVWEHRDLLYPRMSGQGVILPALTGYVDDADIPTMAGRAGPLRTRPIDIGYRARFLPAQFGSYGQRKGLLAERMERAVQGQGLVTDLSTAPDRVFYGEDWYRFLGACKFTLGSEGGSSLWDPHGEVTDRVAAYTRDHPGASFHEVEAACFPGLDRQRVFSAVSPRLFEAAMMRCGQILLEAPYLGVLEPGRHYLPLDDACERAPEVIRRMKDRAAVERMVEACYGELIGGPRFRYSTFVAEVLRRAEDGVARKRVTGSSAMEFRRLTARQRLTVVQADSTRRAREVRSRVALRRRMGRLRGRLVRWTYGARLPEAGRLPAQRTVTMLVADHAIDRRVLQSARTLRDDGWAVHIVALPCLQPADEDQRAFPSVAIHRLPNCDLAFPLPDGLSLPEVERSGLSLKDATWWHNHFVLEGALHPAHVFVAHDVPVLPAAVALARRYRSALVFDAHELYAEQAWLEPSSLSRLDRIERTFIGEADVVTTVNDSLAQELARRHRIPSPAVIWNAMAADADRSPAAKGTLLRDRLKLPEDRLILLYQGNLARLRNLENLVKAMALVRSDRLALVLLGRGEEMRRELAAIAAETRVLDERVFFLPPVPFDALPAYTASADVGIIPYPAVDLNTTLCTPNKLFEFIAAGVPILAADLPELRRFVAGNGFGLSAPMRDEQEIAAAVDRMVRTDLEGFRDRLRARRAEFLWSAQAGTLRDLYRAAGSIAQPRSSQRVRSGEHTSVMS
jgi:glycosyltransferase involved in cell wall biosynthesis